MSNLVLSELWRYPVKSLRGGRCASLLVDPRGPAGDRHWMLVDDDGRFLTQRQLARMALIDTRLTGSGVQLSCLGQSMDVFRPPADAPLQPVRIWQDNCQAQQAAASANIWLSDMLGVNCRLMYLPSAQIRQVDLAYARPGDQTGFSDGFPFLLISQASLDDLNSRLEEPVPMRRFRPNLVVSGCAPYAEDGWKRIRIGELVFRVVKPCSRCIIPTIDPETAERAAEPLRTLGTYRRRDNKIWFGQNLIHDGTGELREGMPVEILE